MTNMRYLSGLLISTCLILTGCTQSLVLEAESDVPVPLVTKLPLNMGVYYEDSFSNYIYEENTEDRPNWSIKLGTSQVDLFNQILPSMFQQVTPVTGTHEPSYDGVLVPEVQEVQFALPEETKTPLYEAWLKYQVHLYDQDGAVIVSWPVTGYGKSSTEFMKGRDEGLQTAINSAFRDIGAKLSINFSRVPEIRNWMAEKPGLCETVTGLCP